MTAWVLWAAAGTTSADGEWRLASDTLLYTDTDSVQVLSTQVAVARELDTEGGQASAAGIVDVVTAASVDVISHATPRFSEVRTEGNMALAKAFGDTLPSLDYRISVEPDYLSHAFGGSVDVRLGGADTVLAVAYHATLDSISRTGTPVDHWSRTLTVHTGEVGITQNLGPNTIIRGVYTLTGQEGYMAKPYRFVPLFDQAGVDAAEAAGAVLNLETFDTYRLAQRPAEQVPDTRLRHAIGLRAIQHVDAIDSAVRLDYRFYVDSWSVVSHTGELSLYTQLSDLWRMDFFGRGYVQSEADFWQRQYVVSAAGQVPRWRSVDRQLSPYWRATVGARLELETEPITAYAELDATHSHFSDYIFLDSRWALVGQLGIGWTL